MVHLCGSTFRCAGVSAGRGQGIQSRVMIALFRTDQQQDGRGDTHGTQQNTCQTSPVGTMPNSLIVSGFAFCGMSGSFPTGSLLLMQQDRATGRSGEPSLFFPHLPHLPFMKEGTE